MVGYRDHTGQVEESRCEGMKVVNVDQKIIVPISDETKGLTYEMQMTLGELLKETLEEIGRAHV